MTSKERVIAALEGREPDGIPSLFSIHFLDPETRARLLGQDSVKAHLKFFREANGDFAKIMFEYRAPSTEIIRSPEEYNRLAGRDLSYMDRQLEFCRALAKQTDPNLFLLGTLYGVWSSCYIPLMEMGKKYTMEEAQMLMATFLRWNEKPVLEMMQRITDGLCRLAAAYIKEAKLDGVYYAVTQGSRRWLTDEESIRWVKPFDLQVMKAVKEAGGYCILHICQSDVGMARFDEDYAAWADGINWGVYDVPMSLEEGREHFKGKTVIGGFANHKGPLVDGPVEKVREEVRNIVGNFGRRGFILGADCTLSSDQDLNLMRAAICEARSL